MLVVHIELKHTYVNSRSFQFV